MPDARQIARWIVDDIVYDLSDRRGLRHEWDQIDDDIKRQIVTAWMNAAEEYVKKYTGEEDEQDE